MRIKHHPVTIVEVYVDGRMELFHNDPSNFLDAIKIGLITVAVKKLQEEYVDQIEPGAYRVKLSRFNWLRQGSEIELKPNV